MFSSFLAKAALTWLAGNLLFLAVAFFLKIRARFRFSFIDPVTEKSPEHFSGDFELKCLGWKWQTQWPVESVDVGSGPGPGQAGKPKGVPDPGPQSGSQSGPQPEPQSGPQAGFLRMPSRKALLAGLKLRLQRAVFMLITDRRVWRGLLRAPAGLLVRAFKTLRPRPIWLSLAHPRPETLGQLAAWHAGVGYASGHPWPVQFDFEDRSLRCEGELRSDVRLLALLYFFARSSGDLPWFVMGGALWRGAWSPSLPGWREKGFRLFLAIFRHLGQRSGSFGAR